MRVLELGTYLIPAYCGRLLVDHGAHVEKWTNGRDPIQDLRGGDRLWQTLNAGKHLTARDAESVNRLAPGRFDVIVDNLRASAWERRGVDPARRAKELQCGWVSMRDDFDHRSFDVIAQARAWGDLARPLPFYLGDTAAAVYVALAASHVRPGEHRVMRHAATLAQLVETHDRPSGDWPLDEPGTYYADDAGAHVVYRGESLHEPYRDAAWRREHLGG